MAEELERQEADRKLQAEKLKNKLEVGNWALPFLADFFRKAESGILFNFHPCCTQEDKKEQENGIVTMFERLKGENEVWRQKNPSFSNSNCRSGKTKFTASKTSSSEAELAREDCELSD